LNLVFIVEGDESNDVGDGLRIKVDNSIKIIFFSEKLFHLTRGLYYKTFYIVIYGFL
jgi:hypothetical protein